MAANGEIRMVAWCKKWLIDLVFLLIVISLIVWMASLVASDRPDTPAWLLVPITGIYAIFTLYMALRRHSRTRKQHFVQPKQWKRALLNSD
jgi:hypothetical protein